MHHSEIGFLPTISEDSYKLISTLEICEEIGNGVQDNLSINLYNCELSKLNLGIKALTSAIEKLNNIKSKVSPTEQDYQEIALLSLYLCSRANTIDNHKLSPLSFNEKAYLQCEDAYAGARNTIRKKFLEAITAGISGVNYLLQNEDKRAKNQLKNILIGGERYAFEVEVKSNSKTSKRNLEFLKNYNEISLEIIGKSSTRSVVDVNGKTILVDFIENDSLLLAKDKNLCKSKKLFPEMLRLAQENGPQEIKLQISTTASVVIERHGLTLDPSINFDATTGSSSKAEITESEYYEHIEHESFCEENDKVGVLKAEHDKVRTSLSKGLNSVSAIARTLKRIKEKGSLSRQDYQGIALLSLYLCSKANTLDNYKHNNEYTFGNALHNEVYNFYNYEETREEVRRKFLAAITAGISGINYLLESSDKAAKEELRKILAAIDENGNLKVVANSYNNEASIVQVEKTLNFFNNRNKLSLEITGEIGTRMAFKDSSVGSSKVKMPYAPNDSLFLVSNDELEQSKKLFPEVLRLAQGNDNKGIKLQISNTALDVINRNNLPLDPEIYNANDVASEIKIEQDTKEDEAGYTLQKISEGNKKTASHEKQLLFSTLVLTISAGILLATAAALAGYFQPQFLIGNTLVIDWLLTTIVLAEIAAASFVGAAVSAVMRYSIAKDNPNPDAKEDNSSQEGLLSAFSSFLSYFKSCGTSENSTAFAEKDLSSGEEDVNYYGNRCKKNV